MASLMAGAEICAVEIPGYLPSKITWEALSEILEPDVELDVALYLSHDPVAEEFHVKDERAKRRILVFRVRGDVDLEAALNAAHIRATAERLEEYRTKAQTADEPWHVVGIPIDFSKGGSSQLYTRAGWKGPERAFRWATQEESILRLALLEKPGVPLTPTPLRAALTLKPFLAQGRIESQRLNVYVNGVEVCREVIAAEQTLLINIPQEAAFSQDVMRITLEHPDAAVPADLMPGKKDRAQLAFAVQRFCMWTTA